MFLEINRSGKESFILRIINYIKNQIYELSYVPVCWIKSARLDQLGRPIG